VGEEWKHKNGMFVRFPPEFLVETLESGVLQAQGKQGFVSFSVQGLKGEKEMKSWKKANQQSLDQEKLPVKSETEHALKSGVKVQFVESERTSEQGVLFVVMFAAFVKGPDSLGMQFYYPKEREKDWTPLFQGVVNSVHR